MKAKAYTNIIFQTVANGVELDYKIIQPYPLKEMVIPMHFFNQKLIAHRAQENKLFYN